MQSHRLSTKKLIIFIAFVALTIWLHGILQEGSRRLMISKNHEHEVIKYKDDPFMFKKYFEKFDGSIISLDVIEKPGQDVRPGYLKGWIQVKAIDSKTMIDYHQNLSTKYRNAAYKPWVILLPDPPVP